VSYYWNHTASNTCWKDARPTKVAYYLSGGRTYYARLTVVNEHATGWDNCYSVAISWYCFTGKGWSPHSIDPMCSPGVTDLERIDRLTLVLRDVPEWSK